MTATVPTQATDQARHLHGPWIDFVCLGGGSIPILCFLALLPSAEFQPYVLAAAIYASHFINNPHFMNSYQIFYDGFARKTAEGAPLRHRYLFAGIAVPIAMILFYAYCIWTSDAALMGKSVNAMFFLVGWHYAKQGYGIIIVESVLKKAFFSDREKNALRYNALAVWLLSWAFANRLAEQNDLYGIEYVSLALPGWLFFVCAAVAGTTSLYVAVTLAGRIMRGALPVNGALAYFSASYVWLILGSLNVLLLIVIPVFHSLQYLAVVWRYQLNKEAGRGDDTVEMFSGLLKLSRARAAMLRFVWIGIMLGATMFWVIPLGLDYAIAYPEEVFGTSLFVFLFVMFINVHHYFMDNVMWRRENKDVAQNLFH